MKTKYPYLYLILGIFIASSCSSLNKKAGLQDDNSIEEMIEMAIRDKTTLDIDLTPNSPEVK